MRPDSKLVIALPTSMSASPQFVAGISTGNSIRGDRYFLLGCGNYRTGGRFVKTNPAPMQPRASIIWHGLKAQPANCQSRIDLRIRNPEKTRRPFCVQASFDPTSRIRDWRSPIAIVIAMIRSPEVATRCRGKIFPTFFPSPPARTAELDRLPFMESQSRSRFGNSAHRRGQEA